VRRFVDLRLLNLRRRLNLRLNPRPQNLRRLNLRQPSSIHRA
jgi:hypothetical protein